MRLRILFQKFANQLLKEEMSISNLTVENFGTLRSISVIITLTQHESYPSAPRQASAVILPGVGSNEALEGVKRLRDDLRHLRERWDDRLVLEDRPFWEVYLYGRAEIVVYGDWGVGSDHL